MFDVLFSMRCDGDGSGVMTADIFGARHTAFWSNCAWNCFRLACVRTDGGDVNATASQRVGGMKLRPGLPQYHCAALREGDGGRGGKRWSQNHCAAV